MAPLMRLSAVGVDDIALLAAESRPLDLRDPRQPRRAIPVPLRSARRVIRDPE